MAVVLKMKMDINETGYKNGYWKLNNHIHKDSNILNCFAQQWIRQKRHLSKYVL
jgi:hypothetical protein